MRFSPSSLDTSIFAPLPGVAVTVDLSRVLPPDVRILFGQLVDVPGVDTFAPGQPVEMFVSEDGLSITLVPRIFWQMGPVVPGAPFGTLGISVGSDFVDEEGDDPLGDYFTFPLIVPPMSEMPEVEGADGANRVDVDLTEVGADELRTLDAGAGDDRLRAVVDDGSFASVGFVGGAGDDTLIGGHGHDLLAGEDGDDSLVGGAGYDLMLGLAGNDRMFGGAGGDQMFGDDGDDLLVGGAGDDTIRGGIGSDTVRGEAGNDRILLDTAVDDPSLLSDVVLVFGGMGDDTIDFQDLDEEVGDGLVTSAFWNIHGGAGNDAIYLEGANVGVARGGAGDDLLSGNTSGPSEESLVLFGGDGNDTVWGGAGADARGGAGRDLIFFEVGQSAWGEAGNDTMEASGGGFLDETGGLMYGGGGDDLLYGSRLADTLHGGGELDTLYGGDGADMLYGGAGDDSLSGGAGADHLSGGAGNDILHAEDGDGNEEHDTVFGGAGDDSLSYDRSGHHLYGGSGNDTLMGGFDSWSGENSTVLDGGMGDDLISVRGHATVTGGAGADRFLLITDGGLALDRGSADEVEITDFTRGTDVLELAAQRWGQMMFVYNPGGHGVEDFQGIEEGVEVAWQNGPGGARVFVDVNQDLQADMVILLRDVYDLTLDDFYIPFPI